MKHFGKNLIGKLWLAFISLLVSLACVKDRDFNAPISSCAEDIVVNATFADVKHLYTGGIVHIQEDLIVEGFVISSDKAGNFFGTLHLQDRPIDPTEGFQIDIDVRDSHLFYEVGSKVYIKLTGLYLGQQKGVFKVGGVFSAFGNLSIGRLPSFAVNQHLFTACDAVAPIEPKATNIDVLDNSMINTLVQLDSIEVVEEELGSPYALPKEEVKRRLKDCSDNEITLLNSGYSDFQAEILPRGNGTITAVLLKDNNNFQLVIRNLDDMDCSKERCMEIPDEFTSAHIFISELADPNNNAGARYVELYNSAPEPLSLKGWILRRYTNANTEVSSTIDLSGNRMAAESTFVISPNATEFEAVYGFPPDLGVSTNSPADSNGDDNLELVDPFGKVIDVFGVVGEDGSGTNHEFEDGRAVRNTEIFSGNPVYTFGEWAIYNDTGGSGTTNLPQNAPEDFTPGVRN